jgi:hypothetical protein
LEEYAASIFGVKVSQARKKLFNPEDGGSMFLQSIGRLLLDYMAAYP